MCVSTGQGKRGGFRGGLTGQEREWWGLHTGSARARGVVYRPRVGRFPWGSNRARKSSLVGQEGVHRVPRHKKKFPNRAEKCPWMSHRAVAVPSKDKAGSPLPEPPTHSCGSSGSGSSCTCRTRRRSRSHLGSEGRRTGSARSQAAGSEAGLSRDRTGHLPAAHVQSWGSMARLGSV